MSQFIEKKGCSGTCSADWLSPLQTHHNNHTEKQQNKAHINLFKFGTLLLSKEAQMNVSIVQRGKHRNPVKEAIQLCAGLDTLKASDKVLIKPNLVIGANKKNIPPFGIVTTSRIIEDLAQALHDYGCTKYNCW